MFGVSTLCAALPLGCIAHLQHPALEPGERVRSAPTFGLGVSEIPTLRARRLWIGDPCQGANLGEHLQDAGNVSAAAILPPMKSIAAGLVSVGNTDDLATSQRHEIDVAVSVAAAGPRRRHYRRQQPLCRVRSFFALVQHNSCARARDNTVESVNGRRTGERDDAPAPLAFSVFAIGDSGRELTTARRDDAQHDTQELAVLGAVR